MRRRLMIGLCALAMIGCCALYQTTEPEACSRCAVYFMEGDLEDAMDGGALRAEYVELPEEMDTLTTARVLMMELLDGPADETLKRVIPPGTSLLSLELQGSRVVVDLSPAYTALSGVALTLADQAITMTLTQLPEIVAVEILVRGRALDYREEQIFTARSALLVPEGDVVSRVKVRLYFLDEKGALTPVERLLELYEGDTLVSSVVRAVEDGPDDKGLSSALPEGFRTKAVWLEEHVCYVNLSSGLLETIPADAPLETALKALARSLCSLESVDETRFLVDGEFAETYGSASVKQPYTG